MTTEAITPLRQRMIEDMTSRKLCAHTQRGHVYSCKRFAAFLKRSPETATCEDIRLFQLHLAETGMSICNRNRIMTGVRFLFRVTLRQLDLAEEIYHMREPEKIPLVSALTRCAGSLPSRAASRSASCSASAMAADCGRARSSASRSNISTARRRSFASSSRRAARIAMSCSRPRCSTCCGNGGRCVRHDTMRESPCRSVGSFPAERVPASR